MLYGRKYAAQAPIQEAFTKFALRIIVLPLSLALRIIHTGSTYLCKDPSRPESLTNLPKTNVQWVPE